MRVRKTPRRRRITADELDRALEASYRHAVVAHPAAGEAQIRAELDGIALRALEIGSVDTRGPEVDDARESRRVRRVSAAFAFLVMSSGVAWLVWAISSGRWAIPLIVVSCSLFPLLASALIRMAAMAAIERSGAERISGIIRVLDAIMVISSGKVDRKSESAADGGGDR